MVIKKNENMKMWKTKKGNTIIQVIDKRSNSYLITMEDMQVLVDTGRTSSFSKLIKNLNILSDEKTPLKHLFLTHSHYDHCQNAAKLKDKYQCEIWLSEHEEDFGKSGFTPLPNGTFLLSKWISSLGQKLPNKIFSYSEFSTDVLIRKEDKIETNGLKVILSPGHTKGSISLIVDEEIAIVGDAMFGIFRNSIMPPFADDQKAMLQSWGKLLDSKAQIFLPGHGKEIKRSLLQKEYNKRLKNEII